MARTLSLIPHHFLSWNFRVEENGRAVADIDQSWWREKGTLTVSGEPYRVYREGLVGPFVLESGQSVLARADKPSALVRSFDIQHAGRRYTLRAKTFQRRFILLEGGVEVGWIKPNNIFGRRAAASFPEQIPLPVAVFLSWLTIILWRRQARASAS